MNLPIKLISTDFDGTLFAEFEMPPVPESLEKLIGDLQQQGAKWVINTGRDMSSLMEALARARISIHWNSACTRDHANLFARVLADVPRLTEWINSRFDATVYQDPYSPFCLIAGNNGDATEIHDYLDEYSRSVPDLTVVRNDVYARFSHAAYNKGTALSEIARRHGFSRDEVFAAGDHLNDLPMLSSDYARWLAAPGNAIDAVKEAVLRQNGIVSSLSHGAGVAQALERCLEQAAQQQ
jgi:HAD superfamily hydrolase (TIGR01484 family)